MQITQAIDAADALHDAGSQRSYTKRHGRTGSQTHIKRNAVTAAYSHGMEGQEYDPHGLLRIVSSMTERQHGRRQPLQRDYGAVDSHGCSQKNQRGKGKDSPTGHESGKRRDEQR